MIHTIAATWMIASNFALVPSAVHNHGSSQQARLITKVKFGKYEAVLRVPEEGLFAQEEIDIEFRVVDTTQKDAVEEGFKGVGAIKSSAVLTMPSMAGMPKAYPETHREGVPGDYGVVAFFPHGGEYLLEINLDIPGEGVKKISFLVDVKDERPASALKPQPYKLQVVDWPKNAKAGQVHQLNLRVIETKTGQVAKNFDVAHEMKFHLLLASKDLNWFAHEHPTMKPDGTWTIPLKFPAGGSYWVYGDVAPSGKGSRVLISSLKVSGKSPSWNTRLVPSTTAQTGGLSGKFNTLAPIEVGRKTTLQVKLFDAKTKQPAGDTVPWLGAAGHMMIFHQDGKTVVHSHPDETKENEALVKKGVIRFNGRFPKAGTYKVYAQFDWRGQIRTLGFTIRVRETI